MEPTEPFDTTGDTGLSERLDSLAAWLNDIDVRLRAAELATGDEATAKELRKAVEALAKHDPKFERRVTDNVDVITDRLRTLASTVSQTSAAIAAKDGEITGLRRELGDMATKVEELGGSSGRGCDPREIARLRAMIDAVAAERTKHASERRIEDLAAKFRLLVERVDSLGGIVGDTAAAVGRRDGDLVQLREQVEHDASEIEKATAEIARLGRHDELETAIARVDERLAAGDGEQAALRARIDQAYSQVDAVVTELQNTVGELFERAATLATREETAAALDARTGELDDRIEEQRRSVGSLQDGLDAQRSDVESQIVLLRAELAAVLDDPRLGELDFRLSSVIEGVDALASRIDQVDGRAVVSAAATASRTSELESVLEELSSRLESAEHEREATAARLNTVAEEAAASAEAAATSRTSGLERALEELAARIESAEREREATEAQLQTVAGDAAARAAAATSRTSGLESTFEELSVRLESVEREREAMAAQLHTVAADTAAQATAATSRTGQLESAHAELSARLESVERGREATTAQLQEIAGETAARDAAALSRTTELEITLAELSTRLESVERERDATTERLHEIVGEAVAQAAAAGTSRTSELESAVEQLSTRLESVEREREAMAAQLLRTNEAPDHEWTERLEQLAAAQAQAAGASNNVATELVELRARVEEAESERAAVASELERVSHALQTARGAVQTKLDELAAAIEHVTGGQDSGSQIAELDGRLETAERLGVAVASELARTTAQWVSEFGTLGERLAQINASLEASARYEEASAAMSPLDPGLADLGAQLGQLEHTSAPAEFEVFEVGGSRVHAELRELQLRMEHAEAAARESREAVLTQLERLGSRVELRLQRLETEQVASYGDTAAQVVPIRGGAE